MKQTFDDYDETYGQVMKKSIGFLGKKHDFFTQAKADCLLEELGQLYGDCEQLNMLDFGCGIGITDPYVVDQVGSLSGVDVSEGSIERAKQNNTTVQYTVYDGQTLPFKDGEFDALFMMCVMHHIPETQREAILEELYRVLRPGGAIFIFEHNMLHPLTRMAVLRCEFDKDAQMMSRAAAQLLLLQAGFKLHDSRYLLYLPFRISGVSSPKLWSRNVPLGAQYFVSGVRPA
jgi:ubiquinone/menaquinone biosynthesis C-methylase UbiE